MIRTFWNSSTVQVPLITTRHCTCACCSVGLVLQQEQDSLHRSVSEFEAVMRDLSSGSGLDMSRSSDVVDRSRNGGTAESFYPSTHSRQVVGEQLEIVTKFHCDEEHSPTYTSPAASSRSNLVQKQIERLYGDTVNGQDSHHGENGKPERKTSGGFFAKRFGICKMKSERNQKVIETSAAANGDGGQMDFKPLKVPAVFRLLRPEFREQLKQNSCKIDARIVTPEKERIIPIRREADTQQQPSSEAAAAPANNNNNNKTPSSAERMIPIRRESGDISSTPKRPSGFAPKVNGFSSSSGQAKQTNNGAVSTGTGAGAGANTDTARQEPAPASNGAANGTAKPGVVRKLSPLSPKHLGAAPGAEKPAPMPKPEHLKSPPMSPEPRVAAAVTPGPAPPPTPPPPSAAAAAVPDLVAAKVAKPAGPAAPPTPAAGQLHSENGVSSQSVPLLTPDTTIVSPELINNNQVTTKTEPQFEEYEGSGVGAGEYDNPEEYPEEFYYDNPPPCGLRERELLCPIMEEDNESTASGSIVNLAPNNGPVIGETMLRSI